MKWKENVREDGKQAMQERWSLIEIYWIVEIMGIGGQEEKKKRNNIYKRKIDVIDGKC